MEHLSTVLSALDRIGVEHAAERLPNGTVLIVAETVRGELISRRVAPPRNELEARETAARLVRDVRAA